MFVLNVRRRALFLCRFVGNTMANINETIRLQEVIIAEQSAQLAEMKEMVNIMVAQFESSNACLKAHQKMIENLKKKLERSIDQNWLLKERLREAQTDLRSWATDSLN